MAEAQKSGPLISVVIPVYNVERYLKNCIDSVIRQDYLNLQIILVDDGSGDRSGAICDEYALLDNRVEVIHKPNGGLVSARKAGLRAAAGEYIGFVDGDDFVDRKMYKELLKKLEEAQADFIHSGYKKEHHSVCGVKKDAVYLVTKENTAELLNKIIFGTVKEKNISPSSWSKLFKRDLLIESYQCVPDTQDYGEDLLCLCNCILRCKKIAVVNQAYYTYVTREGSICQERKITNLTREYGLYRCLCDLFEKYHILAGVQDSVDRYFIRGLTDGLRALTGIPFPKYRYPDIEELYGRRIVIFGAGEVGQDYYSQLSRYRRCEIAAWADTYYEARQYDFCEVIGIGELLKMEFDVLIIGVLDKETAQMIRNSLEAAGIPREKTRWRRPEYLF